MATDKKVSDDTKVMDVARPGKGKVVGTSRPVVGSIVSGGKASNIEVKDEDVKTEEVKVSAPSESRKVIQPLGDIESDTPEAEPAAEPVSDSPVIESTDPKAKKDAAAPEEPAISPEPEPEAKPEESKPAPAESPAETSSESAGVDALAAQAETKKQAAKRAEEEAKKDAALDELTSSKKYYVPISHKLGKQGSSHVTGAFVVLILIIAAVASAYILADAGVIESPVELPFDFIK